MPATASGRSASVSSSASCVPSSLRSTKTRHPVDQSRASTGVTATAPARLIASERARWKPACRSLAPPRSRCCTRASFIDGTAAAASTPAIDIAITASSRLAPAGGAMLSRCSLRPSAGSPLPLLLLRGDGVAAGEPVEANLRTRDVESSASPHASIAETGDVCESPRVERRSHLSERANQSSKPDEPHRKRARESIHTRSAVGTAIARRAAIRCAPGRHVFMGASIRKRSASRAAARPSRQRG